MLLIESSGRPGDVAPVSQRLEEGSVRVRSVPAHREKFLSYLFRSTEPRMNKDVSPS